MLQTLQGLALALRGWSSLFILMTLGFAVAFGWGLWVQWGQILYGLLMGVLWSLLLLCLVWWFQPPAPRAHLLTTFSGRIKAKIRATMDAIKVWCFVLMVLGVVGLTVRFAYLWWQQVPF